MNLAIVILSLLTHQTLAQSLLQASGVTVQTANGEAMMFYAANDCDHCYYYIPEAFRLLVKSNGVPEVSLITWEDESKPATSGGILHFLIEWGLTSEHERQLRADLRNTHDSVAVIMGPAQLALAEEQFIIAGDDSFSDMLRNSLTSASSPATTPASKMAFSFRFSKADLDELQDGVDHPDKITTTIQGSYIYELTGSHGQRIEKPLTLSIPAGEILKYIQK
ncbi:MAG TPA: hypothetical protein VKZ75_00945 [Cyclobacteriaceae bacterium]|nr:hypothetical protein [Cyclobacteriaceae bacterium]